MSARIEQAMVRGLPMFPDGSEGHKIETRVLAWREEFKRAGWAQRIRLAMRIEAGMHTAADLRARFAAALEEQRLA